jgi:CheY-like chemotaxis protein
LIDIVLGDEDGVALTRQLAARVPATRVILISSYARDDLGELLTGSPAVGFLPKSALGAKAIARLPDRMGRLERTSHSRRPTAVNLSAAVVRAALTRAMNMRPRSRHGARCTHARTEWRSPRGTVVDYMARQPSRLRLIGAAIAKTDRVERRIERPLKLRERRRLRQDTRQVASKCSSDDPSKLAIRGMKQAQRPDHALR